jgi:hypothetical protein
MVFNYVVYKITFPNGKIYVGKDEGGLGHSLSYFGSWDANLVEQDFSKAELQDLTLRKQILFESESKEEIRRMESVLIRELRSSDPRLDTTRLTRSEKLRSLPPDGERQVSG